MNHAVMLYCHFIIVILCFSAPSCSWNQSCRREVKQKNGKVALKSKPINFVAQEALQSWVSLSVGY